MPPINLRRFMTSSLLGFLVALQMFDVLVIFFARIRHDAIARFAAREGASEGPWFGEENRILVGDRVLQVSVVHFLKALDKVELSTVLVACRVQPTALVDAESIDDERVPFPAADRMPHELR